MKKKTMNRYALLISSLILLAIPNSAAASATARLNGFAENPSVSSDAAGMFRARLDRRSDEIHYRLSYAGIETFVIFAHIHFSRVGVNGGIIVWLCDNSGNGPDGVPACPQGSGTVEGVLTADDVVGPAAQGIDPGEFDELIDAINARAAYVNVHSELFPSGELRGQLRGRLLGRQDRDDRDDDDDDD